MTSTSNLPIDKLETGQGGGKAKGLALLKKFGFRIPETFVVTDLAKDDLKKNISNLPVEKSYAIRSSASVEDGSEHSFAGQFQSFINVKGHKEITTAIQKCFDSASSFNVESYKSGQGSANNIRMNVIIQEMVDVEYSGVLFTVDPVKQRHDMMSLSVASGIGEELMAGHTEGENHSFYKNLHELPDSKLINSGKFRNMAEQALRIELNYDQPADLEWAIDKKGELWWLQLRPITNLSEVHLNELDHQSLNKHPIYTRGNIGEMMPGPVTPLTLSTFARAIEVGLQVFYKKIGALSQHSSDNLFVHSFYNHLFFDMEQLYDSTRNVLMSKKENIDYAIVGEIVPGKEVKMEAGIIKGLLNFVAMSRYISSAPKAWKKLKTLHDTFRIECSDDITDCYQKIDENLKILNDAYSIHYVTSSQSGALYSAILNIHSKNKVPERRHQEMVAKLFGNIPDVESANVLKSIDELASLLATQDDILENFLAVNNEESFIYLSENANDYVKEKWSDFIERHGHRCVREAELLEPEWAIDPGPVIEGLKTKTQFLLDGFTKKINGFASRPVSLDGSGLNRYTKSIVKYLLPKARKAVAKREQTKAWSISIQYQFKKAYRYLAGLMAEKAMLQDKNLVFFLTHQEIGSMLDTAEYQYWNKKAAARRKLYPEMQSLSFADLSFGVPVPENDFTDGENKGGSLTGIPVSQGIVEGRVRLVNNLSEARLLKEDEIMVAKFTDIGWTPFYSVISGLITEIGSPLSHGAVVAREYGLPAIVSMKGAMLNLKTGQQIKLDAVKGEVVVIEE